MRTSVFLAAFLTVTLLLVASPLQAEDQGIPQMRQRGTATQLVVDGKHD